MCGKRNEWCHSKCKEYSEWRLKQQEQNAKIKKEKEIDSIIRTHIIETLEYNRKLRHK